MAAGLNVQALQIVVHAASGQLAIDWSDGLRQSIGFGALRAACKCAHCEQARRSGRPPHLDAGIRLTALEPYGESALRLSFDDGHDRGIYPFAYLHGLAQPDQPRLEST
jgi:DUF971 family protein